MQEIVENLFDKLSPDLFIVAYNNFLALFPSSVQLLVSLIIFAAVVYVVFRLVSKSWLFILIMVLLFPVLYPVLLTIFTGIFDLLRHIYETIKDL